MIVDNTHTLMAEQGLMINLAYRMLGSLSDAEDAVQEAYARWYALAPDERNAIVSTGAWLNTVVSRICLDMLGSARARRERYVGEWLPEPLSDRTEWAVQSSSGTDPADQITVDESIDMAIMVVLETMTPAERVAFLLHDVFRYRFSEVASIVGRTPGACRQLASSARRRVQGIDRSSALSPHLAVTVRDVKKAWQERDVSALIDLLDPAAVAVADGGGRVQASLAPTRGGRMVAA